MPHEEQTSMLNQFFLFKIHGRRFLIAAAVAVLLIGGIGWFYQPALWLFVPLAPILVLGFYDLCFSQNTITRNFPFLGRFRYWSLKIAPELHQYFVESNTEGKPFNKNQRTIVDQRADGRMQTHPFGTEQDVYDEHYEWLPHSIYACDVLESPPRVRVGGPDCRQPYDAALLNISAMSFGSLSAAAVRALNHGAKMGDFFHDTGEGGISRYHREADADLVWEIGSGYFGCRTDAGDFDPDLFREQATLAAVKMIEIKLSQGAKPGHGGVLPAGKNTPEIAEARKVEPWTKVVSPAYHRTFSDAPGLLDFVARLRELSDGKPVGFKLCIGDRQEFTDICLAMRESGIRPDFITVDGGEGGTGAGPLEFSDSVGMPLEEALVFVSDSLRGYGLKDDIRLLSAGKIITGFDMIKAIALGADICNSARGMMLALGCIQALKCDTNECPTGITTHDPQLTRGLLVQAKSKRVANWQRETVHAAMELLAAMGLRDFGDLRREHIRLRIQRDRIVSFEDIYPTVAMGAYLDG